MRRPFVLAASILLAGCHAEDVAPPVLQRPIESLPPGAHAVLLASDLANTWQRVEAHDLRALMGSLPGSAPALRAPALERLGAACRAIEQATGGSLQDDIVLNVLGGRAGIAVYAPAADGAGTDALLVAELRDPARFRAALAALAAQAIASVRVEADTFDGDPAWRVSDAGGFVLHVVQREAFVVATASGELARAARSLHAGGGPNALDDPALAAALGAVGPHNVVALARRSDARWMAHALTWDATGLHFDHVATVAPESEAATGAAPPRRDAILGSLPDGMTVAAYAHRRVLGLAERRADGGAAVQLAAAGVAALLPMLPGDAAWAGDEIGVALRGVEATPLAPIPDVALVIEVEDAEAAATALRALESRLASLPIGFASRGFEDVRYGGRTFRSLSQPIAERVSPSWMLDRDVAVIATTRTLMQQIVDTRRSGRRSARSDGSFKRFRDFVPADAGVVVYADQRRLRRVAQELERSASLWGPKVEQGVLALGRVSTLLEHFPAGAAYATHSADQVAVRGWMLEGD